MQLRKISSVDVKGKKVLLRVDFNVPIENGKVADETRIVAHLETIGLLRERGAKTALLSHLGRPKGKIAPEYSLKPVRKKLEETLGFEIPFVEDCISDKVPQVLQNMPEGGLVLLENTRFHPEEEANDAEFAKRLSAPFDIFVMDAFSAAHRAHASTRGVADYLPAFAGLLVEKEVRILGTVRDNPPKPLVLVLGGAKVTDKIGVIENMADKASAMLVGGAMAFPFLLVKGFSIGRSKCDEENIEKARYILEKIRGKDFRLVLPRDFVVSYSPENETNIGIAKTDTFPEDMMGLDIGPETCKEFSTEIAGAGSVLWNGPMGMFEHPAFAEGTRAIGAAVSKRTAEGAVTVLGGGDTAAAANSLGFAKDVTHVSTGGGASLEFFEGKLLPGLEPLTEKGEA